MVFACSLIINAYKTMQLLMALYFCTRFLQTSMVGGGRRNRFEEWVGGVGGERGYCLSDGINFQGESTWKTWE